jgi:hypothetical protein
MNETREERPRQEIGNVIGDQEIGKERSVATTGLVFFVSVLFSLFSHRARFRQDEPQ